MLRRHDAGRRHLHSQTLLLNYEAQILTAFSMVVFPKIICECLCDVFDESIKCLQMLYLTTLLIIFGLRSKLRNIGYFEIDN